MMELLLRRLRLLIALGLLGQCALSWWYLASGAGTGMDTLAMTTWRFPPPVARPMASQWDWQYAVILLFMWWVMMIAMMLPSAAPVILLYTRVRRHHEGAQAATGVASGWFCVGYLLTWLGFSLAATLCQWLLERAGLVHAMLMWSTSHALTGTLLLVAGGIMNLVWIAGLAALVLLERLLPGGGRVGRIAGAILLAAGAGLIATA